MDDLLKFLCTWRGNLMYKITEMSQISFYDFNQAYGFALDSKNEWIQRAELIPWHTLERSYARMFPAKVGNVAKPLRMVLGALIIQAKKQLSDAKLVQELTENPYLQFFIGLPAFQSKKPFDSSSLVGFRKRLNVAFMQEANALILSALEEVNDGAPLPVETKENVGTEILDATCAPSNVRFPRDTSLLNEACTQLEGMIDWFHKQYGFEKKPRTYRRVAHKEYLAFAKTKRPGAKKIRATVRKQLGYVARDLRYLADYMQDGYALAPKFTNKYLIITQLVAQQQYMFDHHTHQVDHRIISLSQPFLRPIIRGKAKAKTEFGTKFDVSLDTNGFARIEKLSFDAYNESTVLEEAVENYKERTGFYPERILVDQIYRTKKNRAYCKEHGIRMSGPKLGRPAKEPQDKQISQQDNADRIEVERFFSLAKRCNGMGLIMTKLPETVMSSIALSVLVTNLFALPTGTFFVLYVV